MYKDFISYKLANDVSREKLLEVAKKVVDSWMSKQIGFIKWEIHQNEDGSYTDVVSWDSKESAKLAESKMGELPHAAEWISCYKQGSISTEHQNLIAAF